MIKWLENKFKSNKQNKNLISLLTVILISFSAIVAGYLANEMNEQVISTFEVAENAKNYVTWMKRQHFELVEKDSFYLIKAFESLDEAWELGEEYSRSTDRTAGFNNTYKSKIIHKIMTYESYIRSTTLYILNSYLESGLNGTIMREGELEFTITQETWESLGSGSMIVIQPFWKFIDESHRFSVEYIFQENETMINSVSILELLSTKFPENTQSLLRDTAWENQSILTPPDYWDFNLLAFFTIQKASLIAEENSVLAIKLDSNKNFATIFVSITTVGTLLASAISNRIDNKKMEQNFNRLRKLLNDDEKVLNYEPDKSSNALLIFMTVISLIALVMIVLNYLPV